MQPRDVALRAAASARRASAEPHDRAEVAHAVDAPGAALAVERLPQRGVGVERVVVLQRRRLVEDLVRALDDRHVRIVKHDRAVRARCAGVAGD